MRNEVLRMERVIYKEQGIIRLLNFELNIFEGEIMGLLPLNADGLPELLGLLRHNLPLYDGYIYYRQKLVNSWKDMKRENGRISVIQDRSSLVEGQTVADNIFVLRGGFKQEILHTGILRAQLAPFLADIDMKISADMPVEKLSAFERVVVEILRAVVADRCLIVLKEINALLSEREVVQLHGIMRHYAGKGFSFLYISPHFEEILQICDRAAVMANGQIEKILHDGEMRPGTLLPGSREYDNKVRGYLADSRGKEKGEVVFEASGICGKYLKNLHFQVSEGECLAIQSLDHKMFREMTALITGEEGGLDGEFFVRGECVSFGQTRKIAVIKEQPAKSMLFYGMSYMDNLCFALDHRIPGVWRDHKIRKSIRAEYAEFLGDEVFDKRLEELTGTEKYELTYARVVLQKPDVVFCIQPFKGADMQQRIRIWELQEMLKKKGMAVVILAVNMADVLAIADRVIQIGSHAKISEYERRDFGCLPVNVPWQYLYESEKEA